ncbi:hypothetical protein [Methylovulum psychrotolerans]|uniref:TauD/TfdA-like domain-containing protein n=1 Tax=Methylovulum psychrotolerans TaxID=1704499 RepID=A0A2S5CGT4_9GAMM|nr:hypothetical protein [Methylovulum psychrotolerans]POZ49977.1 hypothetical protein AADEFJLK_04258 [Methylovulum psychrotolerans]
MNTIEITMSPAVSHLLEVTAKTHRIDSLEQYFLDPASSQLDFTFEPEWHDFVDQVSNAWKTNHHMVVRNMPTDNGASTLLAALSLPARFKPYRDQKIVKHFKMSPWTEELSQTIKEGHFHTDLNTAPIPPAATVIHCIKSDPDPKMGVSRVALLSDLINHLEKVGATETLTFLTETQVDMVDERKQSAWSGLIVESDAIRFHPETLRAAARRLNSLPEDLEAYLAQIHESALAVSEPIHLAPGDAIFVSNKRALHYRGACTAQFTMFPHEFQTREIYVLHLQEEPQWSV